VAKGHSQKDTVSGSAACGCLQVSYNCMYDFSAVRLWDIMGQVTIYLDDENEKRLKAAAKAAGMPVSRWVARLVEEKTRTVWPEPVRRLAGAWRDLPDLETIRETEGRDSAREAL